jgi:hypothetical protein
MIQDGWQEQIRILHDNLIDAGHTEIAQAVGMISGRLCDAEARLQYINHNFSLLKRCEQCDEITKILSYCRCGFFTSATLKGAV